MTPIRNGEHVKLTFSFSNRTVGAVGDARNVRPSSRGPPARRQRSRSRARAPLYVPVYDSVYTSGDEADETGLED